MSEALILEFKNVTAAQYEGVNDVLGIDAKAGTGDWPAGLLSHTGCTGADGSLVVFEVWDSQESQGKFMESTLGPALGKVGVPAPARMEWLAVAGYFHTH